MNVYNIKNKERTGKETVEGLKNIEKKARRPLKVYTVKEKAPIGK